MALVRSPSTTMPKLREQTHMRAHLKSSSVARSPKAGNTSQMLR